MAKMQSIDLSAVSVASAECAAEEIQDIIDAIIKDKVIGRMSFSDVQAFVRLSAASARLVQLLLYKESVDRRLDELRGK